MISWDSNNQRWRFGGGFYSTELDPGDTIIIPKKVTTTPWLKGIKDISSVLYNVAVSAGVVDRLFTDD